MERIYLDNNATTALDLRVFQAMLAEWKGPPANPSSLHWFGQRARALLQAARQQTASFFGANPEEILFTSGGTESLNLLIRSLKKGHVITSTIEHSCVYKTLKEQESASLSVTFLPVTLWGAPLVEQVAEALRPDTAAILLSAANNETGVMIDLPAMADLALKKGVPLWIDAVAYVGKESFSLHPGITAVAISGHKFHAPKGIGALYLKKTQKISSQLTPQLTGGNQEYMKRAGTENLAGIIGLAEALQILKEKQPEITEQIRDLRLHFEHQLQRALPDLLIHGEGSRISNTSNVAFLGLDGETLLMHLDRLGIAVSHGSACASGAIEPSRVLLEMGVERKTARSSLRFSFSRMNTRAEIDEALGKIIPLIQKLYHSRKIKT
ncbi:MAG: cysteine desulfurase [Chlamydiia bacterium]|nr:cysteine desulfurase [Chlamydiia bacterium]